MSPSSYDKYICPGCGDDIRVGSSGCPRCAANQSDEHDGDFDYDAFVREEFANPVKPAHIAWIWWLTAILLLATFAWSTFGVH